MFKEKGRKKEEKDATAAATCHENRETEQIFFSYKLWKQSFDFVQRNLFVEKGGQVSHKPPIPFQWSVSKLSSEGFSTFLTFQEKL